MTLRDIMDWFTIQKQNEQHRMLAQNLMDFSREAVATKMGSPRSAYFQNDPNGEQAPDGYVHNYSDSLPFTLRDKMFYQSPGLYDMMFNKTAKDLTPLEIMFKPSPSYKGYL